MSTGAVLAIDAGVVLALMVVTWAVSVPLQNVSIVDVVWGAAFAVVALAARATASGVPARQTLLTVLTVVWGLRLAGYLAWRNAGKSEDWRYRRMRRARGPSFRWRSLVTVFVLQAALAWVVALPVQLGQADPHPRSLGVVTWLGVAVWIVGFGFESIGDLQLARFKADPANQGRVMDRGLWRYTRHPNYFGDACVWWGLWLVAADTALGRVAVVGPVVMTVLLRRVSGVPLVEASLRKRREGYDDYVARTSAFVPRPPRRRVPTRNQP